MVWNAAHLLAAAPYIATFADAKCLSSVRLAPMYTVYSTRMLELSYCYLVCPKQCSCDAMMQMPGSERKDLLHLMAAKGLHTRTDTYEILLKTAADAASIPN